ncbi:tRNA (mnm(5)s(2)U34)-methyltransferase, partial [Desulfofundulus sp.]|uniref:tRNA (mnm(5)s(2)U34)-methyltransferase n=1 Tax=Desulfofundulus sp. TaxID=2282750 RepID=UPI003C775E3B
SGKHLQCSSLAHSGNRRMAAHVPDHVRAVMFNLGYLPGGDHRIITRPESTLEALKAALSLLASGGRVSLVIYTGHPGATEELRVLEEFTRALPPRYYTVIRLSFWNRSSKAPVVILLEKAGAEV